MNKYICKKQSKYTFILLSLLICIGLLISCVDHPSSTQIDPSQDSVDMTLDAMVVRDTTSSDRGAQDARIVMQDFEIFDASSIDMQDSPDIQLSDLSPTDMQIADMTPLDMQIADMTPLDMQIADMTPLDMQIADMTPLDMQIADMDSISADMEVTALRPLCSTLPPLNHPVAYADPNHEDFLPCSSLDPSCTLSLDVLFIYTPLFESLTDTPDQITHAVERMVAEANHTLKQTILPDPYTIRIAGIERLDYLERDRLKSDLITLRLNPKVQALKREKSADIVFLVLGTDGYGGYAYSTTNFRDPEKYIAAINGYYLTDEYDDCGQIYYTFIHELGHLLGAEHRASQFRNPRGTVYGYHNQETHFRRNEAYGRLVNQQGQKSFTMMSYSSYENPVTDRPTACLDCERLYAFSSPDLWWFPNPSEAGLSPDCQFVLVVNELMGFDEQSQETRVNSLEVLCAETAIWHRLDNPSSSREPEFEIDLSRLVGIDVDSLIDHAIPLGVDLPSYLDPADGETLIETVFKTRNRDQLFNRWALVAQFEPGKVLAEQCSLDCSAIGRSTCTAPDLCGPCLSTHYATLRNGTEHCDPRRELNQDDPLHDGAYEPSGVHNVAGLELISYSTLLSPSHITAVELSLSTLDAMTLAPNFDWLSVGATTLVANAAPAHEVTLSAYCERESHDELVLEEWGSSSDGSASIDDGRAQNDHGLHYRFTNLPTGLCSAIEVKIRPLINEGEASPYVFSLDEVRVFGAEATNRPE